MVAWIDKLVLHSEIAAPVCVSFLVGDLSFTNNALKLDTWAVATDLFESVNICFTTMRNFYWSKNKKQTAVINILSLHIFFIFSLFWSNYDGPRTKVFTDPWNIFASTSHDRKMPQLNQTGDYPSDILQFSSGCACCEKYLKGNRHNNFHMARKHVRIFALRHYLFLKPHSFPLASYTLGTDKDIFASNGRLLHNQWNRELTLRCKLKCFVKPIKDPVGVSPSKGNHTITYSTIRVSRQIEATDSFQGLLHDGLNALLSMLENWTTWKAVEGKKFNRETLSQHHVALLRTNM